MIMRLKFLKEVKDFSQPAVNDFPKFKSSSRNKINSKPVVSPKNKKDVCSDVICHSVNSEASSKSNHNITKKGQCIRMVV